MAVLAAAVLGAHNLLERITLSEKVKNGAKIVLVSNKNKQINITSSVEMIDKVEVYDLLGRSIYQKTNVSANEFVIQNLVSSHQALLIKILLNNGQTVSNKIMY